MLCPKDNEKLTVNSTSGHAGLVCDVCNGTWLPFSYIESIKYTHEFTPSSFEKQLSNFTNTESTKACPSGCGNLSIASLSNIELDWCRICKGVWFDKNELKILLKRFPAKMSDGEINQDHAATGVCLLDLIYFFTS